MATDRNGEGIDYGSAEAAEGRRRGAEARAQHMGPITETMLDLAGIEPGHRVLDVAAGTGEQTLAAARRVGPTGSVLAIDIAAQMLAGAAETVREAGLSNVETRVMDARRMELESESFDAAICRLGLMLIPGRDQAMTEIRRVLKPGGRLAAVVPSSPEKNPLTALPLAIARRRAGLPPSVAEDPGRYALADPGALRGVYERAGFRDLAVRVVPAQQRFPSVAAAVQYRLDSSPDLAKLLGELDNADREAARAEIEGVVRQYAGPEGVIVPSEWLIGAGAK